MRKVVWIGKGQHQLERGRNAHAHIHTHTHTHMRRGRSMSARCVFVCILMLIKSDPNKVNYSKEVNELRASCFVNLTKQCVLSAICLRKYTHT